MRLLELLYLMAPAYAANMAPPLLKFFWKGPNPPISRRWLGDHKTWGGVAAGLVAATATAGAQAWIGWNASLVSYDSWPLLGLALGAGALGGDALKSFFKRRRGIAPGRRWIPADQLDFVLGALIVAVPWARLAAADIALIVGLSFAGHIAVNHAAYLAGIRDTRW